MIEGLDTSCTITFGSVDERFCVKVLPVSSMYFSTAVVKPVSGTFVTATATKKAGTEVAVIVVVTEVDALKLSDCLLKGTGSWISWNWWLPGDSLVSIDLEG